MEARSSLDDEAWQLLSIFAITTQINKAGSTTEHELTTPAFAIGRLLVDDDADLEGRGTRCENNTSFQLIAVGSGTPVGVDVQR